MAKFLLFHPNIVILVALFVINQINAAPLNDTKNELQKLNVVVIGAGVSGIASAKHLLDHGHNVTIFEQCEEIGGTWFYTNQTGKNKYGVKVHSAAYQGLRANIELEIMHYPNFPYPNGTDKRPLQADVLKYIHSYADAFNIKKHIKLNHLVLRVLPIEDNKWEVIVKDLPNDRFQTFVFDYVFVCNGHLFLPYYPTISGIEEFKGKILHSHEFRTAETFQNESILIIGNGASGFEIQKLLADVANRTTLSSHFMGLNRTEEEQKMYLEYLQHQRNKDQCAVKRFTSTGADFVDGTNETFSVVIFATGYNYSFPMLSVDTGIHVINNSVSPLYKQIFNIEHPSMVFIGVLSETISFIAYDLQVQFAMKFVNGEKKLPPKSEMYADMHMNTKFHRFYEQIEYFNELAKIGSIEELSKVLRKRIDNYDEIFGKLTSTTSNETYTTSEEIDISNSTYAPLEEIATNNSTNAPREEIDISNSTYAPHSEEIAIGNSTYAVNEEIAISNSTNAPREEIAIFNDTCTTT